MHTRWFCRCIQDTHGHYRGTTCVSSRVKESSSSHSKTMDCRPALPSLLRRPLLGSACDFALSLAGHQSRRPRHFLLVGTCRRWSCSWLADPLAEFLLLLSAVGTPAAAYASPCLAATRAPRALASGIFCRSIVTNHATRALYRCLATAIGQDLGAPCVTRRPTYARRKS